MAEVPGVPGGNNPELGRPQPPQRPEGPGGGSLRDPSTPGVPELPGANVGRDFQIGFQSTSRPSEPLRYGGPMMSSTGSEDPGTGDTSGVPTPPRGIPEFSAGPGEEPTVVPTPPEGNPATYGKHAKDPSEPPTPPSGLPAKHEKQEPAQGEEAYEVPMDSPGDEPDTVEVHGRHRITDEVDMFGRLLPDLARIEDNAGEAIPGGNMTESHWAESERSEDGLRITRRASYRLITDSGQQGLYRFTLIKGDYAEVPSYPNRRDHSRNAWTMLNDGTVYARDMRFFEATGRDPDNVPAPRPSPEARPRVVSTEEATDLLGQFELTVTSDDTQGARVNDPKDVAALLQIIRDQSMAISQRRIPGQRPDSK